MRWFSKAAEQGNAKAQFSLGLLYDKGKGVPRNFVAAHVWFNLAVFNGLQEAEKFRDAKAKHMKPSQLTQAQRLASRWVEKHFR